MNVFVLSTGRCGSMTFARASDLLENFTAGHETRSGEIGPARFDYPDQHIEVDNRLSWFLGSLGRRYDDRPTFYVHLTRDPAEVTESYVSRWDRPFRSSIARAFGHGILIRRTDWSLAERRDVVRTYVDTVTDNITEFLRDRESMTIDLTELADAFPTFADRIGAVYDPALIDSELRTVHNATPAHWGSVDQPPTASR